MAQAFEPTSPLNSSETSTENESSVNQANDRPVVQNLNITVPGTSPVGFTLKGTDPDQSHKLNFTILTQPYYGAVHLDAASGAVTYDPISSFDGDAFTFKATNTAGQDSNVGIVTLSKAAK